MAKPKPKPDDPVQSKRFEETARELGADESENNFERTLEIVIPANKPVLTPAQKPQRKGS